MPKYSFSNSSLFSLFRFQEKLHMARDTQYGEKGSDRINMQIKRTGNNFWNTGHASMAAFGLRSNSHLEPKVKVAPFTRLNQIKATYKGMEGFMSDGTAVNLCDPNSMRD